MAQHRCMQSGAFPRTPSRPPARVAGPKLSRGARAARVSVAGRVATDGGLLLRGDDVVELLGGIGRGLRRRLAASHQHIGTAGRVAQHQHLRGESAIRVRRMRGWGRGRGLSGAQRERGMRAAGRSRAQQGAAACRACRACRACSRAHGVQHGRASSSRYVAMTVRLYCSGPDCEGDTGRGWGRAQEKGQGRGKQYQ